ncbi:hypothetical protein [Streptomyces sp. NPDC002537]
MPSTTTRVKKSVAIAAFAAAAAIATAVPATADEHAGISAPVSIQLKGDVSPHDDHTTGGTDDHTTGGADDHSTLGADDHTTGEHR